MKVSLNIIRQYVDIDLSIDELVEKINTQLGGVEDIIDLNDRYKDAVVVKVVESKKHPNADKLTLCQIDAGTGELVQVVCGANNVYEGMWAVWLPPESIVPSTFEDAEPFKLNARELRGEMSNGMLASARELGIGDDHDGIVDIKQHDALDDSRLEAGASFAKLFGLDDVVIDIENKMFTHRPDCFGQIGVARELFAITQGDRPAGEFIDSYFKSPDWYSLESDFADSDGLDIEVFNQAPELSPRFMAVVIKDVEVTDSPLWLKCQLVAMGAKPINNIVDLTNYIMLMTAQPSHAYDYDKLSGAKIGVRMAKQNEKITLLNGKTYSLTSEDIVIADGGKPIGLGGVMGGLDSEVTAETRNIVLEVANFDMYQVRKTSMRHGLFTDAVTRFNKGQSPLQNPTVVKRLVDLLPGDQASPVFDLPARNEDPGSLVYGSVSVGVDFINKRLGTTLDSYQISSILRLANFEILEPSGDPLVVTAPFWRTDIELPEDIVEEVGRLYGFGRLPRELPARSIKPAPKNLMRELKYSLRRVLASAGANEVLTYSFVHEDMLTSVGQDPGDSYKISNSLSPDLQYYRQSLIPSLLSHIHNNIKSGYDELALFEFGKSHQKSAGLNNEAVPVESNRLGFVVASRHPGDGAAFYKAKSFLSSLSSSLRVGFRFDQIANPRSALYAPFEPKRSAVVVSKVTGEMLGVIGEYRNKVARGFKLPQYAAGFELDTDKLLAEVESQKGTSYQPLSRYPSVTRDVCFRVDQAVSYGQLEDSLSVDLGDDIDTDIQPIDIYQSDKNDASKQITFRVVVSNKEKTLTSQEAASLIDQIIASAKQSVGAEVV